MAELAAADRAVVDAALQEIRDAPPPVDRTGLGCVLALPAFVLLLVFPVVGRRFGAPPAVATAVLVTGIVLLVVGLGFWLLSGGFVRGHTYAAAEAALRRLEAWDPEGGDREEALRAATLLLTHYVGTYGPTSYSGFDRDEARRRVGTLMPLVEAVERHLITHDRWYTVFTADDDADEAGEAGEGEGGRDGDRG